MPPKGQSSFYMSADTVDFTDMNPPSKGIKSFLKLCWDSFIKVDCLLCACPTSLPCPQSRPRLFLIDRNLLRINLPPFPFDLGLIPKSLGTLFFSLLFKSNYPPKCLPQKQRSSCAIKLLSIFLFESIQPKSRCFFLFPISSIFVVIFAIDTFPPPFSVPITRGSSPNSPKGWVHRCRTFLIQRQNTQNHSLISQFFTSVGKGFSLPQITLKFLFLRKKDKDGDDTWKSTYLLLLRLHPSAAAPMSLSPPTTAKQRRPWKHGWMKEQKQFHLKWKKMERNKFLIKWFLKCDDCFRSKKIKAQV